MKQPPKLTPAEQEESAQRLQSRTFLEVLRYQSLINEIEVCLITNK